MAPLPKRWFCEVFLVSTCENTNSRGEWTSICGTGSVEQTAEAMDSSRDLWCLGDSMRSLGGCELGGLVADGTRENPREPKEPPRLNWPDRPGVRVPWDSLDRVLALLLVYLAGFAIKTPWRSDPERPVLSTKVAQPLGNLHITTFCRFSLPQAAIDRHWPAKEASDSLDPQRPALSTRVGLKACWHNHFGQITTFCRFSLPQAAIDRHWPAKEASLDPQNLFCPHESIWRHVGTTFGQFAYHNVLSLQFATSRHWQLARQGSLAGSSKNLFVHRSRFEGMSAQLLGNLHITMFCRFILPLAAIGRHRPAKEASLDPQRSWKTCFVHTSRFEGMLAQPLGNLHITTFCRFSLPQAAIDRHWPAKEASDSLDPQRPALSTRVDLKACWHNHFGQFAYITWAIRISQCFVASVCHQPPLTDSLDPQNNLISRHFGAICISQRFVASVCHKPPLTDSLDPQRPVLSIQ